ncbi:hypothetical protein [Candidatus Contubernalis alkaliaceticus]|uniref:hypothetical protein n=1 Tax=Candidatus Contubernalis alkaliaceticus TaxID=338645 RepID=UPI001F4C3C4A|nr:hypothetical protein [Candidatus Contubernalis alkalaceticus]UNC93055.1 hypothetical protein HUE98_13720 [Candidatus Contubernalis alkalaceticus]
MNWSGRYLHIGTVGNPALEFKGINIKNQRSLECQQCRFNAFCPRGFPARAILNEPTHHFSYQDCAVRKTAFEIVEREKLGIL